MIANFNFIQAQIYSAVNRPQTPNNQNWFNRLSQADYWAAASTIALEISAELASSDIGGTPANNDELAYMPFYIGRKDCSASPDVDTRNYAKPFKEFPHATGGYAENYAILHDMFGWTPREYVAMMGTCCLLCTYLYLYG